MKVLGPQSQSLSKNHKLNISQKNIIIIQKMKRIVKIIQKSTKNRRCLALR